jgi:hypothetical protein
VLLAFSGDSDFCLRMLALRALIAAVELRFAFLRSAPAFLVRLLTFLLRATDPLLPAACLRSPTGCFARTHMRAMG